MGETEMLDEVFKLIRKISLQLDAHEKCTLVSLGLSANQSKIICEIDRNFHFTHTRLAQKTNTSKATLSGALDVMEQKGLIERSKCKHDKRKTYINLTPGGWMIRSALLSGSSARDYFMTTDMTELEKKLLYILLKKLNSQLGATI